MIKNVKTKNQIINGLCLVAIVAGYVLIAVMESAV